MGVLCDAHTILQVFVRMLLLYVVHDSRHVWVGILKAVLFSSDFFFLQMFLTDVAFSFCSCGSGEAGMGAAAGPWGCEVDEEPTIHPLHTITQRHCGTHICSNFDVKFVFSLVFFFSPAGGGFLFAPHSANCWRFIQKLLFAYWDFKVAPSLSLLSHLLQITFQKKGRSREPLPPPSSLQKRRRKTITW